MLKKLLSYLLIKPRNVTIFLKKKIFYQSACLRINLYDDFNAKDHLYIFSVLFNNSKLLLIQKQLLDKHLKDKFVFVVFDNSSIIEIREEAFKVCTEKNINYFSMPKNPFKTGSNSHGICLNWIYKNIVLKNNINYFGFIDHDIFPIKPTSIIPILNKQYIYGDLQKKQNYWYLWAGFCFYTKDILKCKKISFLPVIIKEISLDSGGGNWQDVYSKLDIKKIEFPLHTYLNLRAGDVFQSDKMELIAEWLHTFNGSYWLNVKPKEELIYNYLKPYLN